MKIKSDELTLLAKFIHDKCGIVLDQSKAYLLESRLTPLAEEMGCSSFRELHNKALADRSLGITNRIIDAISTNETSFFRDQKPFEMLKFKIVPDFLDRGVKSLNIWSAACSTGQEVYTIAVTLHELLGASINQYRIKILGTDISDSAIVQSSRGVYTKFEIGRGFPPAMLQKYFTQAGTSWKIKVELRSMALFRKINLMEKFNTVGKFDIIFCRNVAIYFSMDDRKKLFDRLASQLNPHGILIIGSTESLFGVTDRFIRREYHNSTFYELK
jgi:chemotaxis protein methyltransferase CheR